MTANRKLKWWVIIQNDSWINNFHGALALNTIAKKRLISGDSKGHLHCSTS